MPKNLRWYFITHYEVKQRITGSKGRLCLEHKYSCTLEISQIEKENSKSLKIKSMPHACAHTHTHTHILLTYFRNTVSKVMKVILNTFLISVENVPNSTRALVSITAPRPRARQRIQFFKNESSQLPATTSWEATRKKSMCLGLGRLPQHRNQWAF